jgi:hypothetical protein
VNPRSLALAVALVAIVIVLAQDIMPGLDLYHTWQYAFVLAIAMIVLVRAAWTGLRDKRGAADKPLAIALSGAIAVAIAGFLSGLIGPDTVTVSSAPGTVVPIVDIAAAAFFAPADASVIARGDAGVTLRAKSGTSLSVSANGRQYLGTSIVYLKPRPAAFIIARDANGNRLTITQPASTTFLSPVLLFPNQQVIRDTPYPLDTFAVPASHVTIHAIYFSAAEAATFTKSGAAEPALVLSAADDHGKAAGLGMLHSGAIAIIAGVNITATLGLYPQLLIASAPHPAVLVAGLLAFIGGLVAGFFNGSRR